MSKIYSSLFSETKNHVKLVRQEFELYNLKNFDISKIIDEAPAISEIFADISLIDNPSKSYKIKFRCRYEKGKYETGIPSLNNGIWKIIVIDHKIQIEQ
jgi:hypothetical protein